MKLIRFHVFLSRNETVGDNGVCTDLWDIGNSYSNYCKSLVDSRNEDTKFISRFMHMMDSWKDARNAVSIGDWATLEVSALDWMPVWGQLKKPLYQMETMRRMEIMYSLTASELEYYRINRFFRMHKNGNFMSLDDFCEKHNYGMKQFAPHPDIDVMRKKLLHLHAASRCSKLLYRYEGTSTSTAPDTSDDVKALYSFFLQCNVFHDNDKEFKLDRKMFVRNCRAACFEGTRERQKIDKKCKPEQTEKERRALDYLVCFEDEFVSNAIDKDKSSNDGELNIEDCENQSTNSLCSENIVSNNKCNGRGTHAELNKKGIKDLFSVETNSFREAVLKRLTKVSDEKEFERTITSSVAFFTKQMERQMKFLQKQRNTRSDRLAREELEHEMLLRRTGLNDEIYLEALG